MLEYSDNEGTMMNVLSEINSFTLFQNGKEIRINKGNEKFNKLFSNLESLFGDSFIMPAYGVSLHNETQNALKQGEWLQINFNKGMSKNELPFSALLFRLDETFGVDLIRLYNNEYSGRCIHLNFGKNINLKNLLTKHFN